MVFFYLFVLHKAQTIQSFRQPQHAFDDVLQLKIGFQRFGAQVEKGLLLFLSVIGVVPALQRLLKTQALGKLVEFGNLSLSGWQRVGLQLVQQPIYTLQRFGHAVVQRIVGIRLVAKQLCYLVAAFHNVQDVLTVVELVAESFAGGAHVHLVAQRTVVSILQNSGDARGGKVEEVSLQLFGLGFVGGQVQRRRGKSLQPGGVGEVQGVGIVGLQRVVPEGECQVGQADTQLVEALFVSLAQVGATVDKTIVGVFQQLPVDGSQCLQLIVIDGLDALKEFLVQMDAVGEFGEHRLHPVGNVVHFGGAVALQDVEENLGDTVQHPAGMLQGHHSVVKGRGLRVVADGRDVRLGLTDTHFKGRLVMLQLDLAERRGLPRGVPISAERVEQ